MNDDFLFQIFECITAIFEVFIIYQYISSVFGKSKLRGGIICYVTFDIGLVILSLLLRAPIVLITYAILGILLIQHLLYKGSFSTKVFFTFLFGVMICVSDIICAQIFMLVKNISVNEIYDQNLERVFYITLAKIVQIILIKIFSLYFKRKENYLLITEITKSIPLIICQFLTIAIAYTIFMLNNEIFGRLNVYAFLSFLSIIFVNVIMYIYFDSIKAAYDYKIQMEAAEEILEYQKSYYKAMEEHQLETESLRHDIEKHIKLIKALIVNENAIDKSREYLCDLEKQIESIPKIVKTSHPIISALLTNELRDAEKYGIRFNIECNLRSEMRIAPIDLCVILGNAIENAVQACQTLPETTERFIEIYLTQKGMPIKMVVRNNYDPNKKKKSRRSNHGYGLRNIQRVSKKYDGEVIIDAQNDIFQISIIIP